MLLCYVCSRVVNGWMITSQVMKGCVIVVIVVVCVLHVIYVIQCERGCHGMEANNFTDDSK
jgi:hypothetical protein